MKKPNKLAVKKAVYVTSSGYPARYSLVVKADDGMGSVVSPFIDLHGVEVGTLAAANTLVRAMREQAEKDWRAMYADHKRAMRIAAAKRS